MTTDIDKILLTDSATLKAPDVARLTTQSLAGTGVFDILMKTTKLHLMEEYTANRITGEEYTTVYLGALNSVMSASIQFLLNFQQEEKIQSEIALVRQKTVTELANTDNDIPLGLGFNGDANIEGLVALQKEKLELEKDLASAQIIQSTRDGALTGQKIVTELAQTSDNISQAGLNAMGYNVEVSVEGAMRAQIDKAAKETILLEQKVATEVAQTSDVKPITLGEMDSTTLIDGLAKTAREKAAAEVTLLSQKANTELAQTDDTMKMGVPYLNAATAVTGMIGTQKALYQAQADGFKRDAEQKAAKILTEAWSIDASSGDATRNGTNQLDDTDVGSLIGQLKAGVIA